MTFYKKISLSLKKNPKKWLITGVAGFIGSNLLERLLQLDQYVVGIDNFVTGKRLNLLDVKKSISKSQWRRFRLVKGDICDYKLCLKYCKNIDYVLHQAALGSVSRSIKYPIETHDVNSTGFLNILYACKNSKIKKIVFASSSAVYGDHPGLPKTEKQIGTQLSPYAITKYTNEIYAAVFKKNYNFNSIGLRYFNVFGKRQDPNSTYAAVIPLWVYSLIKNKKIFINGNKKISRDFCYIENVVQANILAATSNFSSKNQIFNIAFGKKTTLIELFNILKKNLIKELPYVRKVNPIIRSYRKGDILHSLADINLSKKYLKYNPKYSLSDGIKEYLAWYIAKNVN